MTTAEIQQYVYDYLYEKNLPHITICAVMGNITGESGWSVDIIETGSGIGFGLCQWSFERREKLESYGVTLQHQCDYLWSELTGENTDVTGADPQWIANPHESVDNNEGFEFALSDFLAGAGSIENLTKAFCYCWERPAYATNHLTDVRIPSALSFYETMSYKGEGGTNPPIDPDPSDPPTGGTLKRKKFKFLLYGRSNNVKRRISKTNHRNRAMRR